MKEAVPLILKGAAMGAANVIPGVSGGTVAFVTGIYERLIHAVKSCDLTAAKLLIKGQVREFATRIDFGFLFWIAAGVLLSIVSLARILQFLFESYPIQVYAFFFGLILASVYFVGKGVKHWSAGPLAGLLLGSAIAVAIAFLPPAQENAHPFYLMICGGVAMASMIIPGLSGSFVLLLMGNYGLIMIDSVVRLSSGDLGSLKIFFPVAVGAVAALLGLSHLLSWIFRKWHDIAVALLTGFVAGSLLVIWPWKTEKTVDLLSGDSVKTKTIGYEWFLPELSADTAAAFVLAAVGVFSVWIVEKLGGTED